MAEDVIRAITHIVETEVNELGSSFVNRNRANQQGDNLEDFVRAAFSQTLQEPDPEKRQLAYNRKFSYIGNSNNPPDLMIRHGDAIEVKKVNPSASTIQLNSSYPKANLYSDSRMITRECRQSEQWDEKALVYVVGKVHSTTLKSLWLVYGDCFVENSKTYQKIGDAVSEAISQAGLELSATNELARVNGIDALRVTNLRVRGMWTMSAPWLIFDHFIDDASDPNLRIVSIMREEEYNKTSLVTRQKLENLSDQGITINTISIPNPNNISQLMAAKSIEWRLSLQWN